MVRPAALEGRDASAARARRSARGAPAARARGAACACTRRRTSTRGPSTRRRRVRRLDLAETVLELRAAGVRDLGAFAGSSRPPAALAAAEALLRTARRDRRARARRRTRAADAALAAAPAARAHRRRGRAPRRRARRPAPSPRSSASATYARAASGSGRVEEKSAGRVSQRRGAERQGSSDLIELLELFSEAEAVASTPSASGGLILSRTPCAQSRARSGSCAARSARDGESAMRKTRRTRVVRQGGAKNKRGRPGRTGAQLSEEDEREFSSVCSRATPTASRAGARRGARATLRESFFSRAAARPNLRRRASCAARSSSSPVDAEERGDAPSTFARSSKSGAAKSVVRLASAIEPDWLLDLFADSLAERVEARWNAQGERVEVVRRLVYDQLVIDEWRADKAEGEEVTRALASAALDAGARAFADWGQCRELPRARRVRGGRVPRRVLTVALGGGRGRGARGDVRRPP